MHPGRPGPCRWHRCARQQRRRARRGTGRGTNGGRCPSALRDQLLRGRPDDERRAPGDEGAGIGPDRERQFARGPPRPAGGGGLRREQVRA